MPNYNEEPSNYEQKCLCVLVLDTSGSMSWPSSNPPIDQLNAGLQRFQEELLKDKVTRDRLEVAIVTFDDEVNTVQDIPYIQALVVVSTITIAMAIRLICPKEICGKL